MSSPKDCRTRLIPDTPATQDNFSTQDTTSPHKKVAEAIAELIASDEEGGKSIGLEGGWGSGKTTIVTLLSDQLKKNPRYKVVLFDAWAHEGDPLRRTFLENLIERLTENPDPKINWLDKTVWEERKEVIAQRREIKETSTEPQIMTLGYVVIFLIAFVPIGLALLNASLKDVIFTFDPSLKISLKFTIGLLMSIAPLLTILLGWLWFRLKPYFSKQASSSTTASGMIWAMLVNKAITKETTKTNKTANPTSVEFEYYFAKAMEEALLKNDLHKERKIILVLDNLDRIAPAEGLKILSTLQTFLNPRAKDSDSWHKRVWVLIPYDFDGLSQLWGKEKAEKKEAAKPPVQEVTDKASAAAPSATEAPELIAQPLPTENVVALSFLDKSFQLRFEVPPPVLSRWRAYLMDTLKQAFPDHNREDFHSLYRLYAWYLNKTGKLATPRQLKLYVNQIGSIHRQWKDEFHLSHMAYYVLLRRMNYPVVDMVLKGLLPTPDVEALIAPDATDHLAALAFNTPIAEAKQIRLNNPIQQAFETRIPKTLEDCYEAHHNKGFWEALEAMAQAEWKTYPNALLANVAYCIQQIDLFNKPMDDSYHPLANSVKISLRKRAERLNDWGTLDTQIAEGIAELLKLYPEEGFARSMMKALLNGLVYKTGERNYRKINYSMWSSSLKIIKANLLDEAYQKEFIEPLETSLAVSKNVPEDEVRLMLEAICELSLWDDSAKQLLASLATRGDLLHYLKRFSDDELLAGGQVKQKNPYLMALCSSIFILENPSLIKPLTLGKSDAGYDLLHQLITNESGDLGYNMAVSISLTGDYQEPDNNVPIPFILYFLRILNKHNGVDKLFDIYKAKKESEFFVIECLKIIAENETVPYAFTLETIEREWSLFGRLSDGESNISPLDKLLKRSIESPTFIDDLCAGDFNPEFARLYRSIAEPDGQKHPRFLEWLRVKLPEVSKERWLADFANQPERPLIRLLISVPYLVENLSLPAYQEALVEVAKEIGALKEAPGSGATLVDDDTRKIASADEATSLIWLAGHELAQARLKEKIFEVAVKARGELSKEFFNIFAREIFTRNILQNDPRVFSDLLIPLINTGVLFRCDWAAKILQGNPELLEQPVNAEAVDELRQLIGKKLDEGFANKKVFLVASDSKPPTVSVPTGKGRAIWMPDSPDNSNEFEEEVASPPGAKVYQVDPITAAFALDSGWFEETEDTPYSWSFFSDAHKSLALTPWLAIIAEILELLPGDVSFAG